MKSENKTQTERVSNRDNDSRKYTIEGDIVSTNGQFSDLTNCQVYDQSGIQRAHFNAGASPLNTGASPLNVNFSGEPSTDAEQLEIFTAIQSFVAEVKERVADNA